MGFGINPSPCLTLSKVDQSSYKLNDGLEPEDDNKDGYGCGSNDDVHTTRQYCMEFVCEWLKSICKQKGIRFTS